MAFDTTIHTQTGFTSMDIPGATQVLPTSGLLTGVLTPGARAVEVTVQFTTAGGSVFVPGTDVGDFSMTLWRQSVSGGVTSYAQGETVSGLHGYVPHIFDSMADAGICGVAIHAITSPVDVAAVGFKVIARTVNL